jgi:hypothetical protein
MAAGLDEQEWAEYLAVVRGKAGIMLEDPRPETRDPRPETRDPRPETLRRDLPWMAAAAPIVLSHFEAIEAGWNPPKFKGGLGKRR